MFHRGTFHPGDPQERRVPSLAAVSTSWLCWLLSLMFKASNRQACCLMTHLLDPSSTLKSLWPTQTQDCDGYMDSANITLGSGIMGWKDTISLTKTDYFHIWNTLCIEWCKQTRIMFIFIFDILNYFTGCHHQISDTSMRKTWNLREISVQHHGQGLVRWLHGTGGMSE